MRLLRRLPAAVFLVLASTGVAFAQSGSRVAVDSNLPGAILYADSLELGRWEASPYIVPASAQMLVLVPPLPRNWAIAPVEVALPARRDSLMRMSMLFPLYHSIRSVPFGAAAFVETGDGRTAIGHTPVIYRQTEPNGGVLVVEKEGFRAERLALGDEVWNTYDLALSPVGEGEGANAVTFTPVHRRRNWIDYAATGLALGAAGTAIYYKFRADDLYEDYDYGGARQGDPELRRRIERLDVRSGVALGAMQVGVGVLAVRLVLRR